MILDGHIHIGEQQQDKETFLQETALAGVEGGVVFSMHPACFRADGSDPKYQPERRLDGLFSRLEGSPSFYPFFWIDPLEDTALEQVDLACRRGVMGFKVICDRYYPYEDRPMEVFRKIASMSKPILFHSGILWDGKFSSVYNRPSGFEALIGIGGLRFALAHASWPWCDECIALYGKFQNTATEYDRPHAEMFIDITPGTPEIYRRDLLTKLYTVGYDVENNILFGTDCVYDIYSHGWAKKWQDLDGAIYRELGLGPETVQKVYRDNLLRFVGVTKGAAARKPLTQMG